MGNSQRSIWDDQLKQYYQNIGQFHHPYLGNIIIYQHKQNQEQVFQTQSEAQALGNYDEFKYKRRTYLRNPQLINVIDASLKKIDGGKCSGGPTRYKFVGIWEYPGENGIITINIPIRKTCWPEPKLWQILYQILQACSALEQIGQTHSDLRASSIFIKNDKILLVEPTLVPGLGSSYQKALFGEKPYLSPQQLDDLLSRKMIPTADPLKSDVFAFGMTLLSCAIREDAEIFYDMKNHILLKDQLNSKIMESQLLYSQAFNGLLNFILTSEESKRPTFLALQKLIQPYQQQINSRMEFYNQVEFSQGRFISSQQLTIHSNDKQLQQSQSSLYDKNMQDVSPLRNIDSRSISQATLPTQNTFTPTRYINQIKQQTIPQTMPLTKSYSPFQRQLTLTPSTQVQQVAQMQQAQLQRQPSLPKVSYSQIQRNITPMKLVYNNQMIRADGDAKDNGLDRRVETALKESQQVLSKHKKTLQRIQS